MAILVTGAAGYIGSHTCFELLAAGFEVVGLDNLSNSCAESLRRVERLTGRRIPLVVGDIRNQALLEEAIRHHRCEVVIHFAGLKAVGESVQQPLAYYDNNLGGTVSLLSAMRATGMRRIIFSSSATVYGEPQRLPIDESHPRSATNPYGRTKLMIEDVLQDLQQSDPAWQVTVLRYFNPVGAHPSGEIGEDPRGTPNNLMPFVAQVAVGRQPLLNIWGNDYRTVDGTGVRDYVHVVDLAKGHVKALQAPATAGMLALNLGTGKGYSVLEVVRAFEQASGRQVPFRYGPRRPGDVASCYADASLAERMLGWRAEKTLAEMCADHWRWQTRNPNGYAVEGE